MGKPKNLIKAYGIFDGGGVRGAALAGCLAVAQSKGIEFLGYGGTSAGSIIALLACVGYSGLELKNIMIDELKFSELLDDGGKDLTALQGLQASKNFAFFWQIFLNRSRITKIIKNLGLYNADKLRDFLYALVKRKVPSLTSKDFTFKDLQSANLPLLKIVASNIGKRDAKIFSNGDDVSVLDAVRASMCFPFVFRPVIVYRDLLVDGGLSSNLPIFLFENERKQKNIPVFGFDLVSPERSNSDIGFLRFCQNIVMTALESHERILQSALTNIYLVKVETPSTIDTLNFNITSEQSDHLYRCGETETQKFFEAFPHFEQIEGNEIRALQVLYASEDEVKSVLYGFVKEIEEMTKAKDLRANVMLPNQSKNHIIVYQYGMDGHTDEKLQLPTGTGCSGRAWTARAPFLANPQDRDDPSNSRIDQATFRQVKDDRKSVLSVPIFYPILNNSRG